MRYVRLSLRYADTSAHLSLCGRELRPHLGSSIHASILKNAHLFTFHRRNNDRDVMVIWNSLLSMYSKSGHLLDAAKLFDRMEIKDTVSWNSVISGCLMTGKLEMGFQYLKRLHRSEMHDFDHATLTTVLSACCEPHLLYAAEMTHCLAIVGGYEQVTPVGNALITMYFKCGCFGSARKLFDGLLERNVITWTAMVSGLAQGGLCGESLMLFREMWHVGEAPNSLTYSSSLLACSGMRALAEGQQIHVLVVKSSGCAQGVH